MRELGKIETVHTPVTEKQGYTHGDVRNVIARLQHTNFLKAIKLNPIHIRAESIRFLYLRMNFFAAEGSLWIVKYRVDLKILVN